MGGFFVGNHLTGFKHDNGLGANHGRVLTWYAGTLDLSLDGFEQTPLSFVPPGYQEEKQPVYDQLGESALIGMNVKAGELTSPWYDGSNSSEGIGTGWFYSYLGGGEDLRTHSAVARTSVFTDNSNLTQQKGDNAVPAVFNGTFDSALNQDSSNSGIPGWSFNNGQDLSGSQPISGGFKLVNQKNIVNLKKLIQDNSALADWADCQNIDNSKLSDYHALRLNMDTGNVAIHNKTYLSATAQTLSFDLFTPNLSGSTAGDTLKVYMSEDGLNFNEINSPNPTRYSSPPTVNYNFAQWGDLNHRPAVDLQLPDNSLASGYDIQYQLNRPDYARRGFETFYLNIPDRFRGKNVYIKFELSSTHAQTIYLDNVGVANANTKLGLPRLNGQLAVNSEEFQTQFKDNYLIVKPQYTLSYNDATKIPNWVSFQLNCSWIEQEQTVNIDRKNAEPFSIDTDIPLTPVLNDYYKSSLIPSLQRGHLAGADERKRTQKDLSATFVTSNILPSFEPEPWQDFEKYLRGKVMDSKGNPLMDGKDVYIITGGYGNSSSLYPNEPVVQNGVTVPDHLWKIAVILKSTGYRLQDIDQNAISEVVAIDVPNRPNGDSLFGGKTTYSDWLTEINTLENKTGLTFLANLPELLQTQLKNTKHWLSAPLLAENFDSSLTSPLWTNDQITIGKDSIPQQSTSKKVIPVQLEIGTGLGTFKVSPFQDGVITSGIEQAGITQSSIIQPSTPQVGIIQTSTSQISSTQDRRAQIATRQIGTFEVTPSQISSSEIGTSQIDSLKIAATEITPGQLSSFQVGTGKIKLSQDRFGEIGTTQITGDRSTNINMNSFDLSHSQVGILQINTSDQTIEISSSHNTLVDLKSINIGRSKIDFTQVTPFKSTVPELGELEVSTSEIGINKFAPQFNFTQIQSPKVSYPGIVTSSQLFTSDLSHDASPNLLTNIYNTAQTLWHTTTPLDLNFAITNLPTRQLAEATVTGYDHLGRPNTATISIDNDANGVGWFIDTTPGDNSEFTGTDTYFQATPSSAASGKYDLLTAILHEMGHTLGFINGYSQFNQNIKGRQFYTDLPTPTPSHPTSATSTTPSTPTTSSTPTSNQAFVNSHPRWTGRLLMPSLGVEE